MERADIENGFGESASMRKILVFASTFPRWKNDTIPGFVYELSKRLTKDFDVSVLTPMFPGAKKVLYRLG